MTISGYSREGSGSRWWLMLVTREFSYICFLLTLLLACGSFFRGRKRRRVDSRPLLYYRGDYMVREPTCRRSLPPHQTNYPVSQSYIYQTRLVHDSPATRTQSSIENLVPQTAPLLGTRCYLRNSSWTAR